MKDQQIEQLIADTINNNPIKIKFRGKEMAIPRPTLGTLIEASKAIAELPKFEVENNAATAVAQTLNVAKDCGKIAEIMAILMLGKQNLYREINVFGMKFRIRNRFKRLVSEILTLTSKEISEILVAILSSMDCGFFLGITISLQGINTLKRTTTETTALGQQSQVSSKISTSDSTTQ